MTTMYKMAEPTKKSRSFKKMWTKLSAKNHFLQCCRGIGFNKLREPKKNAKTNKIGEDKPFRDVLNPEDTKENLERKLLDLGIAGLGDQLFDILIKAFHLRGHKEAIFPLVRGMFLYGPTGCGKSVLAYNFHKFLPAKEPLLIDAFVVGAKNGENIRRARSFLKKAIADEKKYGAKSDMYIVVLDGMEHAFRKGCGLGIWDDDSDELLQQLFRLMDGPDALNNIFVIATTDRIDLVDQSVLRPGKFELLVKLDYPTEKQRIRILDMKIRNLRNNRKLDGDVDVRELAMLTGGWYSASVSGISRMVFPCAFVRNGYSCLDLRYRMEDFVMAINNHEQMVAEAEMT